MYIQAGTNVQLRYTAP